MKEYNFDEIIERKNTNSLKFDCATLRGLPEDTLPLWVADMDFRAPDCVLESLQKCVDHGIFGYSEVNDSYAETVAAWFDTRFGWKPETEWLIKIMKRFLLMHGVSEQERIRFRKKNCFLVKSQQLHFRWDVILSAVP